MSTLTNRRKLRYAPDKLDVALLMYNGLSEVWAPDECCLIIDESAMSGCQLAVRFSDMANVRRTRREAARLVSSISSDNARSI